MAGGEDEVFSGHKPHRASTKGRKADKKQKGKGQVQEGIDPKIRNPKAYAINSVVRAERKFRRGQDHETKKDRVPLVDRTPVEPPPFVVAVVGPPKVGKSTLLMNLIKNYTRQTMSDMKGPVTIVSGKKRRVTFIECNNDIHSMIDVAKVADLALLLVDASFGFEMEVFEFLNICQVHGFPQIMGVLTHLDVFRNKKKLKKTKKNLKHRFWTEVYPGAKLFYLSGYYPMTHAYPKNEVHNLARFISVMKFRQTLWRSEHAYVVADRMEDLTSLEAIRVNGQVDRNISLYGYVHGTFLKQHVSIHVPGLGDFKPEAITALPDPCPLPMKERTLKRSLNEREKIMYAPFSGVGGIVYDQDAVYIDLGGSHSHNANSRMTEESESNEQDDPQKTAFVGELRELKTTLNEKMDSAGLQLFSTSESITGAAATINSLADEMETDSEVEEEEVDLENSSVNHKETKQFTAHVTTDGRVRRKVIFEEEEVEHKSQKRKDEDKDDITFQMRKELSKLKKNPHPDSESDGDSSADEESEEDEEEVDNNEGCEEIIVKKPLGDSERRLISPKAGEESIYSIISKIKTQLKPTRNESRAAVEKGESLRVDNDSEDVQGLTKVKKLFQEAVKDDDDVADSDEELESEDEEDDVASKDNSELENNSEESSEDEMEQRDAELQLDNAPSEEDGNDQKNRYSIAEESFYSRFRNRSVQKMIYDDTDDYLNITAAADFDIANCAAKDNMEVDDVEEEEMKELFIGGDYAETAKNILDADDNSEDDFFGDFEELDEEEPIKKRKVETKDNENMTEESSQKNREEMKKKLKEKFDIEYDDGGDDKTFYKDWKAQVEEQTKINRTYFEDVEDPNLLRDLQGLAPGTYVRVELSRVPHEFVTNFHPQRCCPLVVGSLDSPNQETLAVVQARVKKHRWHPKILKTRDPVIMSIGWRRFQTVALYSTQDHNMRNRMIKYTPDHLHCIANFYGPMTPQGAGILGIAPSGFEGFRITMTGTILDMDKSSELVKKLKLVGSPAKIFKKSAFIEGMFSSQLEVAKFVGAKIKTVSGVRGVIKKELRAPPGSFRATFEDKILQSDIVFCRTWAKVDVPPFYLNLPTLIVAQPRLMKTVGELKRERMVQIEPNPDNLYTPIVREEKNFRPLKIPKSLQEKLPYKDKPKILAKLKTPQRIAVIKDPHEREMTKFLKGMKNRMNEREAKEKSEKAKKAVEKEKVQKRLEAQQDKRQKELRKKVFRTLGLMNKSESNDNSGKGGGRGRRPPPKHKR